MNFEQSIKPQSGKLRRTSFMKNLFAVIIVGLIITIITYGLLSVLLSGDNYEASETNKVMAVQNALINYDSREHELMEYDRLYARIATEWKVALGGAGVVLFGLLGAGFIGSQLTIGLAAWADYVIGSLLSSAAAGIASVGAYKGWNWGGPGGEDGNRRRDLDQYGFPSFSIEDGVRKYDEFPSLEFYTNHSLIGSHFNVTASSLGFDLNSVLDVSYYETHNVNNRSNTKYQKRDGNIVNATVIPSYAFTYNHSEHWISVAVPVVYLEDALVSLANYVGISNNSLAKRQSSTWVSYSTYGENTNVTPDIVNNQGPSGDGFEWTVEDWFSSQIQPCTSSPLCYAVANKGCLAMSEDSNRGENSGIVGEFYTDNFGGIDNQCDSG